eukprot:gene20828-55439_t
MRRVRAPLMALAAGYADGETVGASVGRARQHDAALMDAEMAAALQLRRYRRGTGHRSAAQGAGTRRRVQTRILKGGEDRSWGNAEG